MTSGFAPHPALARFLTVDARSMLFAVCGALAFGLLAYISIAFTRGDERIAAVWLPNAVAVAVLLRARIKREHLVLLGLWIGNTCANLVVGDSPSRAASLAFANSAEILVAVMLVRRLCGRTPDMRDIRHLIRFVISTGLAAPAASATIATIALSAEQPVGFGTWFFWLATDGLGMLIIAPSALIAFDAWVTRRRPSRETMAEWALLTVCGTSLTIYVFAQSDYPFLFLVAPVVLSHAFRLGTLGTAFSILKVALVATIFTWNGSGPISLVEGHLTEELMTLQLFIATSFFIGLPVAAILHGREAMTRQLLAQREELDTLARCMVDAVLRFDNDGICTYASPSVMAVLGKPPSFYLGRPASKETHPGEKDRIAAVEKRLISGESERERFTYCRIENDANGEPVFIEADCAVTYDADSGERNGIIVSSRDVTSRVKMEADLVRARRHAEQAAQAKSEFLANMSHEIRTPMNGVLGFAELLLQSGLRGEQRRQAEMIHDSGRSMMLLLNDILDFSKIEAGQVVINREPFDLHDLLHSCTQLQAAYAQRKNLTLTYRESAVLHRQVLSDPHRVRQIVLNLIGNALKFTETGGVEVSISLTGKESLAISVTDTGIGIPQERQEMIFTPFQQADGKTSRRYGGTGLGLTISRQLAELLGGSLSCRSTPGEGSSFTLTIPLELADATPAAPPAPEPQQEPSKVLQPARILLAEDHDINRLLATSMLERCGQHVSVAHDGDEAIIKAVEAQTCGEPFDLILMDIQMPGCDGYSATRKIRSLGLSARQLPIVALTANAFAEDIAAARDAGMQGHLAKPLVFAELMQVLQRWLPSKIVEEDSVHESFDSEEACHIASPPLNRGAIPPASAPSIRARWRQRRAEAISAVQTALSNDALGGEVGLDLARTVHKLAGTAGVFGEAELGAKATALERALKAQQPIEVAEQLAQELLQTAAERGPSPASEAA